ncbi:AAA family ATPase [Amycolatopsis sp. NPDC051903]|uniref:helix-turn-helix transcriptional regulator n=1 Tax=Amycolatopsis sp. NPDC051903 TaxID=3363936 RepID=UPI0037B2DBBF
MTTSFSSSRPGDGGPAPRLRGRERELRTLEALLAGAREGRGGALLVRGEPGIGKTALISAALAGATDLRVTQVRGAECESAFPYAGLHQLCAGLLERLPLLPDPQHAALRVAFGLADGPPPNRLLLAQAVMTLLRESAVDGPLACVVDHAQWLDRASLEILAFVARRCPAAPVALVVAVRGRAAADALAGVAELRLEGLADEAARALLATVLPARLDERIRARIVAEARGNPLALLELYRGVSPAAVAGGLGLVDAGPELTRVERRLLARLRELREPARLLLLIAAAEPEGDPVLLRRAADHLGLGLELVAATGLLSIGERVLFRRPLVRSALYRSAPLCKRRQAHQALVAAIGRCGDPEQRLWHRAHAAVAPDEALAGELERSAARARARWGVAAAASFLTLAAELTPEPGRRIDRVLCAAQAKLDAGAPGAASDLVVVARATPLDELRRARVARMCARIALEVQGTEALPQLLSAAQHLATLDPALARETYVDALGRAIFTSRPCLGDDSPARVTARAAKAAPPAPGVPRAVDLLLDGLVLRFTEGYRAAVPTLREAVRRLLDDTGRANLRWLWFGAQVANDLFDAESGVRLAERQVELARAEGMLTMLPRALCFYARLAAAAGCPDAAAAALDEADSITNVTGAVPWRYSEPYLAAYRGDEVLAMDLVREGAAECGQVQAVRVVHYATALLYNSLGRYPAALAAARSAAEYDDDLGILGLALAEVVEAAARCGEEAIAGDALDRLVERACASGTALALGLAARSRALLSTGATADALYREAVTHLERSGQPLWLARTHLVHGEWLRRANHRVDARASLRPALDAFTHLRADGFATRAHHELLATGEPAGEAPGALTAQETHIARLAADGHTNHEIAARLVLSPRTVEWHLSRIYAKLGVTSRRRLATALPGG